ncbi:helix-turn-helix domain-containing protein [Microbacterium lacticum]
MKVLTSAELFGELDTPLRVRDIQLSDQSQPVSAEAVKIMFVLAGHAQLRSGNEVASLSQGSIFTIPAQQACHAVPTTPVHAVNFYLHPDYVREQLRWLPQAQPLVHQLRGALDGSGRLQHLRVPPEAMRGLSPMLVRLSRLPHHNDEVLASLSRAGMIFDAVGKYAGTHVSHIGLLDDRKVPSPEVIAAISLMRQQIDRPWNVDDLARHVALSSSQLTRLFRAQLRESPAAYFLRLRADKMAEFLSTTNMSVADAARAVGWANPAVAARAFKRRYAVSPREFAAQSRQRFV